MRRCVLCLCAMFISMPLLAQNIVLVNGTMIDGSGKPRLVGNVRIRDGKVADVGAFKPLAGETVFDIKGMIVAPGFIDVATLSPAVIEKDAGAEPLTKQGVTTALLGSDGTGPYSVEEFMLPFDERPAAVNIAMLVGHGTVRHQIMGANYKRAATPDEIERMTELISDAMKQGAFGMGTDLQSEPASLSAPDEL
jgi:N-acyl-D-amino-acid deacylase